MRRRALLGLLGGTLLEGAISTVDPVRRQLDAALGSPITDDDVAEWTFTVGRYEKIVRRLSAEQVLPSLLVDLDDLRQQMQSATGDTRGRLIGIGALLSGLAAISLVSAGIWSDAQRYWRTAGRAARASGDRSVRSVVASNRAVYGLDFPASAPAALLNIADEALALEDGAVTEGAALAVAARAQLLSLLGDRTRACEALNQAETLFEKLNGRAPAHWMYHARSFTYSHIGTPSEAFEAQDLALAQYRQPFSPGPVQVQMHRARTLIASGDTAEGLNHVVTTLERVDPALRHGFVGTSAEFALRELSGKAESLPEARRARELTSREVTSG